MSETGKQHISALMDDALSTEESRFLLRRMQHESDLVDAWSRYHLVRDCLQGRPAVLISGSLAERVMQQLQQTPNVAIQPVRGHRRWLQLGAGGAIAASVAAAALMLTQPPSALHPASSQATSTIAASLVTEPAPVAVADISAPTQMTPAQDFSLLLDQPRSPWLYVQPAAATRQQPLGYVNDSILYPHQPQWLQRGELRQAEVMPHTPIYIFRSPAQAPPPEQSQAVGNN